MSSNEQIPAIDTFSEAQQPGHTLYQQFEHAISQLNPDDADSRYGWEILPDSDIAEQLISLIQQAPEINHIDPATAPFRDYRDNTDERWQYVPADQVRDFLDSQRFVDTQRAGWRSDIEPKEVSIRTGLGETIAVPTGLIVNAAAFSSWQGRSHSRKKPMSKPEFDMPEGTSHNTIKHYAALETELPAVSFIRVYVQPDGTVFADNDAGDSHRIAAAMLRGKQNIQADVVTVRLLDENFLSTQQ